jgi:hypothetical protein|tara:strand:+ start:822 stop:1043 length:222 start_codon:yes stop_codon:yes gene_type:complete
MGRMSDHAIDLLQDFGDVVDIHYTQFLEVAFFLKVAADERLAIAFIKRKVPMLTDSDIRFLISEIVNGYQDGL